MLETSQLRMLAALADHRSFTKAAESLSLTQSAVSHQMKRIERLVGGRVLLSGRGVHFTPTGERLVDIARRVISLLGEARAASGGADDAEPAEIRIGCPASLATYVLPEALREFRECLPNVTPVLKIADTSAVLEGLRTGGVDVGLMLRPSAGDGKAGREIASVPLAEDRLAAVVHPEHPWAAAGRVDRRSLSAQSFILYDTASLTGRMVRAHLRSRGVPPERCLEVGNMEAIKQLVRLGLGVTFLAGWVCAAEAEAGSLVRLPVDRPRLVRRWVAARHRVRKVSFAEQLLVGLCADAARLRMGDGGD
jgi:DNA-binding transcriptional LysR family regulator